MSTQMGQSEGQKLPVEPAGELFWKSNYTDEAKKRQLFESLMLVGTLAGVLALTFWLFRCDQDKLGYVSIAGLAGLIGGLLHSCKWFYGTVARK